MPEPSNYELGVVWHLAKELGIEVLEITNEPALKYLRLHEHLSGQASARSRLVSPSPFNTGWSGYGEVWWGRNVGSRENRWFIMLHEVAHAFGLPLSPKHAVCSERTATLIHRVAVNELFGPVSAQARVAYESDRGTNDMEPKRLREALAWTDIATLKAACRRVKDERRSA